MKRLLVVCVFVLLVAVLSTCSNSAHDNPIAALVYLNVNPANSSLPKGTIQQFTATGVYSDEATQDITAQVIWSSSDTSTAIIDGGGLATGIYPGTTSIFAKLGDVVGSTTLTVTNAVLKSLSVTPEKPSIIPGIIKQFKATGTFADGATRDVTAQVIWSSSTASIAAISSIGLATGINPGTATITAELGAVTGSTELVVTDATPLSVTVTPANLSISKGTTQQFTAMGVFSDGATHNITSLATWSTSDASKAAINGNGFVTSEDVGTLTITANFGDVSGSTTLDIMAPRDLANSWTMRSSGVNLNDIIWADTVSQFVAVGKNGTILTSSDGSLWTAQTSGTTGFLRGIAWSGTKFVAVGEYGTILTSPDGMIWTKQVSGTYYWLSGITWSGSLFVTVGEKGTILSSPDGLTWSAQIPSQTEHLKAITWAGTKFVAVGNNGIILTSPEGSNWTRRTWAATDDLSGVAWSGTMFAAVGFYGRILTSTDGENWTPQPRIMDSRIMGVTWSGTKFVAVGGVGYDRGSILTSPDGVNWTTETVNTENELYGVTWSGVKLVAVGSKGTILESSEGVIWATRLAGTTDLGLNGVTWTGARFFAVGNAGTISISDDGVSWTKQHDEGGYSLDGVVWSGTQIMAVGGYSQCPSGASGLKRSIILSDQLQSGWAILSSLDGESWTLKTIGATDHLKAVVWSGTMFAAVGSNGAIHTSPDGLYWGTSQASDAASGLSGITWSGTQFAAVGDGGNIFTSSDGANWLLQISGTPHRLSGVIWSGTQFVVVGDGGEILTSPDGVNWTEQTSGTTNALYGLAWSGRQFVAVGSGGAILTSPDGVSWTAQTFATPGPFNAVVWSGTQFVAVGQNGLIATSP